MFSTMILNNLQTSMHIQRKMPQQCWTAIVKNRLNDPVLHIDLSRLRNRVHHPQIYHRRKV